MKHYIGTWYNGITYAVTACNGDDAWRQLMNWADQNIIQNPAQFMIARCD